MLGAASGDFLQRQSCFQCFLFVLLFPITRLTWAFQSCHPRPSPNSDPFQTHTLFLGLGAAQGGGRAHVSMLKALGSIPRTNKTQTNRPLLTFAKTFLILILL